MLPANDFAFVAGISSSRSGLVDRAGDRLGRTTGVMRLRVKGNGELKALDTQIDRAIGFSCEGKGFATRHAVNGVLAGVP